MAGACTIEWALALALAAPHVLYGWIWFFPGAWRARFGKRSVFVFDTAAWVLKVFQFSTLLAWYKHARAPAGMLDWEQLTAGNFLVSLLLGGAGQALNIGIFRAIGHVGVYYGFKLGHEVPWVNGFPFNVVSHPQYVGAVLSVWGALAMVWQQAPAGTAFVALYWTALYAITAVQESNF